ncbi:MAG: carboxypeptidase regulatory-like domain-containing protein [Ilumatobacter sp.]|uniref:carboxypeptidase regulatory-like domain-containing protein n=1 Tax=Ilumatobacter sp. TaxID=1967498 RepID=UPI00261433A5|nr:carboxypeptidase regulatory-like domain-containing protein [Ilumatobacter sp.]MDJ0769171.1 carboxypeptidase regulatory-like domain-containing protein [Ilumatobacter sp.]
MTPASRRSIRRVSLVAAIVGIGVASSGTATAQEPETGVVEGRVTNADTGEPVPDQTISLNSGGILALADTDADGSYRLEDIALGPATLATPSNQPAWEDFSTEIDVVAGTQTIDIALTPRGSSAPTSTAPPTTLVTSPSLADQLPETGESSTSLIAVSIALLAGGWVLLAVSRRGAGFRPDRSGERARSAA